MTMATAQESTTITVTQTFPRELPFDDSNRSNLTTAMPFTTTMTITSTTSEMNITILNSTATMATTNQTGKTTEGGQIPITPRSIAPSKTTSATTKGKDKPKAQSSDAIGIVIIIIIIVVALGCAVACYIVRNRGRRYSVDFVSRQDEANIPLSIVDPELPGADTVPQNGLQTFENTGTTVKAPEEAETDPKREEDEKSKSAAAEADKSAVDPVAESVAAAPSPHDSEDKPKEDVAEPTSPAPAAEPTSPAPAPEQPSPEEKTDDEAMVSNKTSVESLKETNENNSNNAPLRQKTDLDPSNIFWVIPLDSPV